MICSDQSCSLPSYNYSQGQPNTARDYPPPYNYSPEPSGDSYSRPAGYQDPYHKPSPPLRSRQPINPDPLPPTRQPTRVPVKRSPQTTRTSHLPQRRDLKGPKKDNSILLIVGIGVIVIIITIGIILYFFYSSSSPSNPSHPQNPSNPSNPHLLDHPNPESSPDDLIILPKSEEVEYYDVDTGEILVPSQLNDFLPA